MDRQWQPGGLGKQAPGGVNLSLKQCDTALLERKPSLDFGQPFAGRRPNTGTRSQGCIAQPSRLREGQGVIGIVNSE
jgi:hypothetical protein